MDSMDPPKLDEETVCGEAPSRVGSNFLPFLPVTDRDMLAWFIVCIVWLCPCVLVGSELPSDLVEFSRYVSAYHGDPLIQFFFARRVLVRHGGTIPFLNFPALPIPGFFGSQVSVMFSVMGWWDTKKNLWLFRFPAVFAQGSCCESALCEQGPQSPLAGDLIMQRIPDNASS